MRIHVYGLKMGLTCVEHAILRISSEDTSCLRMWERHSLKDVNSSPVYICEQLHVIYMARSWSLAKQLIIESHKNRCSRNRCKTWTWVTVYEREREEAGFLKSTVMQAWQSLDQPKGAQAAMARLLEPPLSHWMQARWGGGAGMGGGSAGPTQLGPARPSSRAHRPVHHHPQGLPFSAPSFLCSLVSVSCLH